VGYQKISFRLPPSLKDAVEDICRPGEPEPQKEISGFVEAAIDAGEVYFDELLGSYERISNGKRKVRMVVMATSISEAHARRFAEILKGLQTATEQDQDGEQVTRFWPPPTMARVWRAVIQRYVDASKGKSQYQNILTNEFLSKPALVRGIALPIDVKLGSDFAMPSSIERGTTCLIDASVLLVATVRTLPGDEVNPVSQRAASLIHGSKTRTPRVLLHRGEAERYLHLLWNAVRPDPNGLLFSDSSEGYKPLSEDEAKAYVSEKGRQLLASAVELFNIEPAAIFEAACLPESVSEHIRAQVAQARLNAHAGDLTLVSATRDFCALRTPQMAVWHPNDVNLARTAPDRSKMKAPETATYVLPVCQDKPRVAVKEDADRPAEPYEEPAIEIAVEEGLGENDYGHTESCGESASIEAIDESAEEGDGNPF